MTRMDRKPPGLAAPTLATRYHDFALVMVLISEEVRDLRLAIEACDRPGDQLELHDDPQDPLGVAAGRIPGLLHLVSEGRRLARGDRSNVPPDPALALELLDGARRLLKETRMLNRTICRHLLIRAHRRVDATAATRRPGR